LAAKPARRKVVHIKGISVFNAVGRLIKGFAPWNPRTSRSSSSSNSSSKSKAEHDDDYRNENKILVSIHERGSSLEDRSPTAPK